MSPLESIATYPGLIPTLRVMAVSAMLLISGLSFCLSVWVMPMTFLASPEAQIEQYVSAVDKGRKYLQTSSRTMMFMLVCNAILTAIHPEPNVSEGWQYWVGISLVLIIAAPYEIYFIFPINDEVEAMSEQLEKKRQPLTKTQQTRLRELVKKWAARNFGRVTLPFVAGVLGMYSIATETL